MRIRKLLATIGLVAALGAGLAACGSSDDDLQPSARGPVLAGHATCMYINTPAECQDSGVDSTYWQHVPAQQPVVHDSSYDTLMALWTWQMMYHTWYASPYYVNRYVPVAQRTVYREHWVVIDRTYHSQEIQYQSKATYRTSSGKTVSGSRIKTTQFKAPAPKNNGGSRGKITCNAFIGGDLERGGSGGGRSGGGRSTGGGLRGIFGGSKPKPPAPKLGGDRGKGGTSQHGC